MWHLVHNSTAPALWKTHADCHHREADGMKPFKHLCARVGQDESARPCIGKATSDTRIRKTATFVAHDPTRKCHTPAR